MKSIAGIACALVAASALLTVGRAQAAEVPDKNFSIAGLASSYVRPEGTDKVPLAVIISGSGRIDRNGNDAASLNTDAYKQLAHALADLGIASVRYDKRGVGGSANLPSTGQDSTIEVYAKDAAAIATWGKQQAGVHSVILVGHSEGGVLALLAAKNAAPKGVVLLSTPGRPLGIIMREQLENPALPPEVRAVAIKAVEALERGEEPPPLPPSLESLFRPGIQAFLKSWIKTDPAQLLRDLDMPALVIGGGRDIQIQRADFSALTAARSNIKSHWYPAMGHMLKVVEPSMASQARAYMDPAVVLADGLADWIAAFIHDVSAAAKGKQ